MNIKRLLLLPAILAICFVSLGDYNPVPANSILGNNTGSPIAPAAAISVGTGVLTALGVNNNAAGGYSPIDGTATLTNKRVTPRVPTALVDASTITPASDTTDAANVLTLSQATQFLNPTGTPTDHQQLEIRIKSTSTRALTYDTQYRGSSDLALPATTSGSSLTDYMKFEWNAADSKWDIIGRNFGH